jgi:hypothetical protein
MIMHTPLDFIVVAYPRSGSTWVANWLTTDRSLCLHDPFALGMPEAWPSDDRLRGISCTGAYLLGDWLGGYSCPLAIIERDRADCDASLTRIGLQGGIPTPQLAALDGYRIAFDDLWQEDAARGLWAHLLPSVPFDVIRHRLLCDMQVQPHMGKWAPDVPTLHALLPALTLKVA